MLSHLLIIVMIIVGSSKIREEINNIATIKCYDWHLLQKILKHIAR